MSGQSRARYTAVTATAVALLFAASEPTLSGQAQGSWPFVVQWEHDGERVAFYRLCVGGQCRQLDAQRDGGTLWRAPLPLLPGGDHRLVLQACNDGGACADGTPDLMVRVVAPSPRRPPVIVQPVPGQGTANTSGGKP